MFAAYMLATEFWSFIAVKSNFGSARLWFSMNDSTFDWSWVRLAWILCCEFRIFSNTISLAPFWEVWTHIDGEMGFVFFIQENVLLLIYSFHTYIAPCDTWQLTRYINYTSNWETKQSLCPWNDKKKLNALREKFKIKINYINFIYKRKT